MTANEGNVFIISYVYSMLTRPNKLESHPVLLQIPRSRVVSMGHRNTGSKSGKRSVKSYIRARALIHTESTVLFRFN